MPNELAPCPFCGASGAELVTYHEPGTVMHPWYRIECDHCGAKGPGTDRGTHREDWNRRAAATAPASRGMSYADRIANRLAQWKNWRPTTDAVAIAAEADAEIAALTATTNEAAAQADGRETVFETMQIAFGHKPPPEPMEVAQPVQAQGEAVAVKCWPFVESPGDFTERFKRALDQFPTYLAALRNVLIENPPTLSADYVSRATSPAPAVDRGLSEDALAAADALLDLIRAIPEHRLLACDDDPHPPSALSVSADALRAALAASAPSQAGSCQASGGRLDADWIVREVAELPDRNSPTDWPDAMLVTADELRSIILAAPPAGRTLTECHGLDTPERVCFYEQDFYVLSNFSSFNLQWQGHTFPTSEHTYHWEKFNRGGGGAIIQQEILSAPSAHEAFKVAERQKAFRRSDWGDVKIGVMRAILHAKAAQHEYVRRKLLATGDRELVENSWRDDFWGWGPNRDGKNMLGKLWMEVRAELRAASSTTAGEQP